MSNTESLSATTTPLPLSSPLSKKELDKLELAWLDRVKRFGLNCDRFDIKEKDGIRIYLTSGGHLYIRPDIVVFNGAASKNSDAIRATIDQAIKEWGCQCAINGSEDFKLNFWKLASAYGVTVTNYAPPDDKKAEAEAEVERLKAEIKALADKADKKAPADVVMAPPTIPQSLAPPASPLPASGPAPARPKTARSRKPPRASPVNPKTRPRREPTFETPPVKPEETTKINGLSPVAASASENDKALPAARPDGKRENSLLPALHDQWVQRLTL